MRVIGVGGCRRMRAAFHGMIWVIKNRVVCFSEGGANSPSEAHSAGVLLGVSSGHAPPQSQTLQTIDAANITKGIVEAGYCRGKICSVCRQ
jgi:hypothetical protein